MFPLGVYGNTELWCWVSYDYENYRIIFFGLVIPSWFVVLYFLRQILKSLALKRRVKSSIEMRIVDLLDSNKKLKSRIIMFVAVFLFSWFFPILNRLVEMAIDTPYFPLEFITAATLPLQGFLNAICYGGGFSLYRFLCKFAKESKAKIQIARRSLIGDDIVGSISGRTENQVIDVDFGKFARLVATNQEKMVAYTPKMYSIFITTLNMGEASVASVEGHVKDWILEGHDIYAVGLQECLDIVSIRELILSHLGGPSQYVMLSTEIGSGNTSLGYHGFIALTLFVRRSEIENGINYYFCFFSSSITKLFHRKCMCHKSSF